MGQIFVSQFFIELASGHHSDVDFRDRGRNLNVQRAGTSAVPSRAAATDVAPATAALGHNWTTIEGFILRRLGRLRVAKRTSMQRPEISCCCCRSKHIHTECSHTQVSNMVREAGLSTCKQRSNARQKIGRHAPPSLVVDRRFTPQTTKSNWSSVKPDPWMTIRFWPVLSAVRRTVVSLALTMTVRLVKST